MTSTDEKLTALDRAITLGLNRIHDEAIVRLRSMAKSTGQRTRADRIATAKAPPLLRASQLGQGEHGRRL